MTCCKEVCQARFHLFQTQTLIRKMNTNCLWYYCSLLFKKLTKTSMAYFLIYVLPRLFFETDSVFTFLTSFLRDWLCFHISYMASFLYVCVLILFFPRDCVWSIAKYRDVSWAVVFLVDFSFGYLSLYQWHRKPWFVRFCLWFIHNES